MKGSKHLPKEKKRFMLEVKNLSKSYKNTKAVSNISFEVKSGEYFTILGPSGCGKSTLLHLIAGLITPDEGVIKIGDKVVTSSNDSIFMEPRKRNIGMLFQEFSLYPDMNVYDNLAFPLRNMKMPENKIKERIERTTKLLNVQDLLDRNPAEMSGGEKRRIALGKAIIKEENNIFLLDEPLSAVDAKLRIYLRKEIKSVQKKLNITVIGVTHDQETAMAVSDRIMIMNKGKCQTIGTPRELYEKPSSLFVADFIGSPAINQIRCDVIEKEGKLFLDAANFSIPVPANIRSPIENYIGDTVILGIRPPDFVERAPKDFTVKGKIEIIETLGPDFVLHVDVGGNHLIIQKRVLKPSIKEGNTVDVKIDKDKLHLFDKKSGKSIFRQNETQIGMTK